jgi:hypothetical protein
MAMACLAGGRRTNTAFERFAQASKLGDYEYGPYTAPGRDFLDPEMRLAAVNAARAKPQVEVAGAAAYVFHGVEGERATPNGALVTIVALDDAFQHTISIPRVVRGRLPDPDKVDEIAIDESAAQHRHLDVGGHISLVGILIDDVETYFTGGPVEHEALRFTVTGIVRYPEDLTGTTVGSDEAYMTRAYWDRYGKDVAHFGPGVAIRTKPSQAKAFERAIQADPRTARGSLDKPDSATTEDVQEATGVQSAALLALAAVLGTASLLLAAQALVRHLALDQGETEVLRAIGLDRQRRAMAQLARVAAATGLAVIVAVVVAVAMSPVFPIGVARDAEPDPGISADALVLLGAPVSGNRSSISSRRTRRASRASADRRARHRLRAATGARHPRCPCAHRDRNGRGRAARAHRRLRLHLRAGSPPRSAFPVRLDVRRRDRHQR